jgi:glycosyltransferase involved in cell wall biosynthesis
MTTEGLSPALKRILVLSNRYYPYYKGGYSLECKAITDELINRGYDVHVLTSNWHAPKKQVDGNIYRLLHIREPAGRHPLYRRWKDLQWALTNPTDYRTAHRLMQSLAPDIVYVWNMGHLSLSPLAAAQDLGLPLVFALADYWLLKRYRELYLEPNQLKRAYRLLIHGLKSFNPLQFPYLIVNNPVLKQYYVKAGFPAEHISVIPAGLQAHFILDTPHAVANRSTIELLYAGRLSKEKGVDLAIRTVALLNQELASELDRPVHLDIVGAGDPSYVGYLQELAASLDLQQAVRFIGKLSQEELIDRYKHYDAVLMPYIWVEPFGGVSIEAMAQGTCVIASDHGGPARNITHGHDGLLVPPEDPRAIARAVIDLVQDGDLRDRIRHAAVATVRKHYSLDKVGDQVEAYLNATLAKHHLLNRKE